MNCIASSILVFALAGCLETDRGAQPVGDYCVYALRVELRDLAPLGTVPTIGPDGWPTASVLTKRDARHLGGEAAKYDRRCVKREGPR